MKRGLIFFAIALVLLLVPALAYANEGNSEKGHGPDTHGNANHHIGNDPGQGGKVEPGSFSPEQIKIWRSIVVIFPRKPGGPLCPWPPGGGPHHHWPPCPPGGDHRPPWCPVSPSA